MLKLILWLTCLLFLSGCCRNYVNVRTEYFNRHSLASYYVGTPDPKLSYPEVGQRLILSWKFEDEVYRKPDLRFDLTIRFGNKEEVKEQVHVYDRTGIYTYTLYDDVFFDYDGIQTYKVDLYSGDELISEWRHQLWVDMIIFEQPKDEAEEADES
jgi:hypothetical protein